MQEKIKELFDINNFNIYSDDNYYYFFRALNMADNDDLDKKIIADEIGNISRIRTNLERYQNDPKYSSDAEISLEEMCDHIKMHQRKDTNCISLTSNANSALTYGRGNYKDKYVIVKVKKEDINNKVYPAGQYMLEEIDRRINEFIANHDLENYDMQKYFFDAINNASTQERLDEIKRMLPEEYVFNNEFFLNGLEFLFTNSGYYQALDSSQNLLKNKVIMKLDVLNKQLLPTISNRLLIETIGNAFSSLELIHYKDIQKEEIVNTSKEVMDILGLIQQLPSNIEHLDELKAEIINNASVSLNEFEYKNSQIDDVNLSLDNMYSILNGNVSYKDAYNLYKEVFYLAKSKLRAKQCANNISKIVGDNHNYQNIISFISNNTYGIEPEITTRLSKQLYSLSESVSLNIRKDLLAYVEDLDIQRLEDIISNPNETIKTLLSEYVDHTEDLYPISKEEWYANSIIDLFDWESLGVKEVLSYEQRQDIINALIEHNFMDAYSVLKMLGTKEKDIAYNLFYSLIRNTNQIDRNRPLSLEEIEWFIGYNRIKETNLNLRKYQRSALNNLNRIYQDKQFGAAVLPTGTGKSYLALAKMLENPNAKMIYIAPNDIILDQIQNVIRNAYSIKEEHLGERKRDVVRRAFPNLILGTYQILQGDTGTKLKQDNYDLIILDELHRSGASTWQKDVEELLDNQDKHTRILGITATPERDMDNKDMAELWASKYGYTDEEIKTKKHLAINMDLEEAIRLGIVANPKVVNCLYSLKSSGKLAELRELAADNISPEIKSKYEKLRREVENSKGIEDVLNDNLNSDDKVIVFIPITKKGEGIYEDEDGNRVSKSDAEHIIKDYITLFRQYMFASNYLNNNPILNDIYKKILDEESLSIEEQEFLNNEKDNILLLSKIDITNKPSELNTEYNYMAETIIKYLKLDSLSKTELASKLHKKTIDKIDTTSLSSSYSKSINHRQLELFNAPTNGKIKAMFVMNKLNEGAHLKGVKKIVWFRPLDSNSRILFYQQLGRCITALNPGETLKEEDIPTVIDLVNNTLSVDLDRGISQEEKDLNKLLLIDTWIKNNNKLPDITSSNKEEISHARSLIFINKRYKKYVDNSNLLNEVKVEIKEYINEIIKIGSDIDLWNIDVIEEEKEYVNKNGKELTEQDDLLTISPVIRDFIELERKLDKSFTPRDYVKTIEEYCESYNEWPSKSEEAKIKTANGKTGCQLYEWLNGTSGYIRGKFKYMEDKDEEGRPLIEILDELKEQYHSRSQKSPQEWVKIIEEYCKVYREWPSSSEEAKIKTVNGKTGNQLNSWLANSNYYSNGNFQYKNETDENGRLLIEILDELKEQYHSRSQKSPQEWVKIIEEYCKVYREWPNRSEEAKIKTAYGKNGKQLNQWLKGTAEYYNGNFKYKDEVDETGRPLIEILDELSDKYKKRRYTPQEYVEAIRQYCQKNKKWPVCNDNSEENSVNGKTGSHLYEWLVGTSNYISGKFKYIEEKDEDGRPLIEILDELKEQYHPHSRLPKSPQEWVKIMEEYCKVYREWPTGKSVRKIKGITGKQLFSWLYTTSNYISGKFKYIEEKDEDGRPLIEILDELKEQYHPRPSKSPQEWVKIMEEYCKVYREWPTEKSIRKIKGITGKQLFSWLYTTSNYISGKFKYIEEKDEDGRPLIEILDELKEQYHSHSRSQKSPQEWVKIIEEYCKVYREWPNRSKEAKIKTASGKTVNQLISWLNNTNYYDNDNFKYKDEVDETGRPLIEILDELSDKYKKKVFTPQDYTKAIEEYCRVNHQWPRKEFKNKQKEKLAYGKNGTQLYEWLKGTAEYYKGSFRYKDEVDENGRPLIDILDSLYEKYGKANKIVSKINQLQEIKEELKMVSNTINQSKYDNLNNESENPQRN